MLCRMEIQKIDVPVADAADAAAAAAAEAALLPTMQAEYSFDLGRD